MVNRCNGQCVQPRMGEVGPAAKPGLGSHLTYTDSKCRDFQQPAPVAVRSTRRISSRNHGWSKRQSRDWHLAKVVGPPAPNGCSVPIADLQGIELPSELMATVGEPDLSRKRDSRSGCLPRVPLYTRSRSAGPWPIGVARRLAMRLRIERTVRHIGEDGLSLGQAGQVGGKFPRVRCPLRVPTACRNDSALAHGTVRQACHLALAPSMRNIAVRHGQFVLNLRVPGGGRVSEQVGNKVGVGAFDSIATYPCLDTAGGPASAGAVFVGVWRQGAGR